MNYEKKYKEALARARALQETCDNTTVVGWCEYIFPELNDKDEKIRRELITHFRNTRCVTEEGAETMVKWVAWLEKQYKQLNADKVIAWIRENIPMFWEVPCSPNRIIDKFKNDFEL